MDKWTVQTKWMNLPSFVKVNKTDKIIDIAVIIILCAYACLSIVKRVSLDVLAPTQQINFGCIQIVSLESFLVRMLSSHV